jgi:hypothetical protein
LGLGIGTDIMIEYCIAGYIGGGLYLAILAVSIVCAKSKHRQYIAAPFQETANIVKGR